MNHKPKSTNNSIPIPSLKKKKTPEQRQRRSSSVTESSSARPNSLNTRTRDSTNTKRASTNRIKRMSVGSNELNGLNNNFSGLSLNDRQKWKPFEKYGLRANGISYIVEEIIGEGSFGTVLRAKVRGTSDIVAIKKVLQDKRFKNRELQIMTILSHHNVVTLYNSFCTNGQKQGELYLNLVLEYVPETIYQRARYYSKLKQNFPLDYAKLYMYQLFQAIKYIHSIGVCHRDIKPQNLLVNPETGVLKLCDFGSAKMLVHGETNVSYICSRYYRAPELSFGSTTYSNSIDVWSSACVLIELLIGKPLFAGKTAVDQLHKIIKVLGTPTPEQVDSMNKDRQGEEFPIQRDISPVPWSTVLRKSHIPEEASDLAQKLFQYVPENRASPQEACDHPFFDEVRDHEVLQRVE